VPVLVAELGHPDFADLHVFGNVGFLTGEISHTVRPAIHRARVFAGHAGWGAGQLDREMDEGSWILDPAREEDVFTPDPDGLWRAVLERKGPDYQQMARVPFDPRMN